MAKYNNCGGHEFGCSIKVENDGKCPLECNNYDPLIRADWYSGTWPTGNQTIDDMEWDAEMAFGYGDF